MFLEYFFHLNTKFLWVMMLILQFHLDVAFELIILCENHYHRNFKITQVNLSYIYRWNYIWTYYSYLGKYPLNASNLTMANYCPSGYST